MAALTTVDILTADPADDLDGDLTAATDGTDTAETGSGHFLLVFNGHATESRTITIEVPSEVDGHAVADATLSIEAEDYGVIPLTGLFRGTNGRASITYSDSAADITVAVYKLGK